MYLIVKKRSEVFYANAAIQLLLLTGLFWTRLTSTLLPLLFTYRWMQSLRGQGVLSAIDHCNKQTPSFKGSVPATHPCQLHGAVRKEYATGRWMTVMPLSLYPVSMLTAGVGKWLWSPSCPCSCPKTSPSWDMGQNPGRIPWARPPPSATLSLMVVSHVFLHTEYWRSTEAEKYQV